MEPADSHHTCVGIIGDPVAHSLSPRMQNAAFEALGLDWRYLRFRVAPKALAEALRGLVALEFVGANVTIPHKQATAALVDMRDALAERIGAVNAIRIASGRLEGFNTDAGGVLDALTKDGAAKIAGSHCLVIGAGGAGRAAAFALAGASAARVTVLNRTESRARGLAEVVAELYGVETIAGSLAPTVVERAADNAAIIVQATTATMSAAMGGGGGRAEWLAALLPGLHPEMTVLDMVYTPPQTELLAAARARGATAVSGLAMLVYQGARSFELWTGRPAPIEVMKRAVGLL